MHVKGAGSTPETQPEAHAILMGAGLSNVIVNAGTSISYGFKDTARELMTLNLWLESTRLQLYDCVAQSITTTISANGLAVDRVKLIGRIASSNPSTTLVQPIWDSSKPVKLNNLSFTYGGIALEAVSEFTINLENETVAGEGSLQSSDGFVVPWINGHKVSLSLNPLHNQGVTTLHWHDLWNSNFSGPLTLSTIGATSGNRVQFVIPNASIMNVSESNRAKLLSYEISLQANETIGTVNTELQRIYS